MYKDRSSVLTRRINNSSEPMYSMPRANPHGVKPWPNDKNSKPISPIIRRSPSIIIFRSWVVIPTRSAIMKRSAWLAQAALRTKLRQSTDPRSSNPMISPRRNRPNVRSDSSVDSIMTTRGNTSWRPRSGKMVHQNLQKIIDGDFFPAFRVAGYWLKNRGSMISASWISSNCEPAMVQPAIMHRWEFTMPMALTEQAICTMGIRESSPRKCPTRCCNGRPQISLTLDSKPVCSRIEST